MTKLTVSKSEVVKAIESHCNGVQNENWQFFGGFYVTSFFYEDECPNVNTFSSGYDDFLRYSGDLSDTDENYQDFINSVREWCESVLTERFTDSQGNTVEVTYIN